MKRRGVLWWPLGAAVGLVLALGRRRAAALAVLAALCATSAVARTSAVTLTSDSLLETTLHQLDLATGDLAPIGTVGPGQRSILAVWTAAGVPSGLQAWVTVDGLDGPDLVRADLLTGETEVIGSFGLPGAGGGGLAFHPSGALFAIDFPAGRLLTVDPATGAADVVGTLGIDLDYYPSFTADACGRLWLLNYPLGEGPMLHEIDPASGVATPGVPLAEQILGLAARGETLVGIVFNPPPAVSRLVRIDPVTGQTAELLPLEPGFLYLPNELDFAPDGDLWGVGGVAIPIDPVPPASFRIDPQGDVSGGPQLALTPSFAISAPPGNCGNGSPLAIPAASPGGLVALVLLLAACGAALARGSRKGATADRRGHR